MAQKRFTGGRDAVYELKSTSFPIAPYLFGRYGCCDFHRREYPYPASIFLAQRELSLVLPHCVPNFIILHRNFLGVLFQKSRYLMPFLEDLSKKFWFRPL